jgi:hypothetical protein
VVVDGGRGEQARYRGLHLVDAPVAKDQHRGAAPHRVLGLPAQGGERLLHPGLAGGDREEGGERGGARPLVAKGPDLLELRVREHGLVYKDAPAVLGRLVEEVLLGPEAHLERHDELFAQGVYGRVGDLREVLLEVREQSCGLSERTASGVSVPIEPSGSLPFWAMGARIMRWSSMVYPKARWRCRSVADSGREDALGSGSEFRWISPASSHSR